MGHGEISTEAQRSALIPNRSGYKRQSSALNSRELLRSEWERDYLDPSSDAVGYVFSWELTSCRIGDHHTTSKSFRTTTSTGSWFIVARQNRARYPCNHASALSLSTALTFCHLRKRLTLVTDTIPLQQTEETFEFQLVILWIIILKGNRHQTPEETAEDHCSSRRQVSSQRPTPVDACRTYSPVYGLPSI